MAKVHHSIIKSAASKGVVITNDEDGNEVTALHTATGIAVTWGYDPDGDDLNTLAKDAWAVASDMVDFQTENKAWKVAQGSFGFVAETPDGNELEADTWEDLLEAIKAHQEDAAEQDAEADEEDVGGGGSVVPARYKELYKTSGVKDSCGDWLAVQAQALCRVLDGKVEKVDVDKVELLVGANGVSYPAPASGNRGWEGRYRMTALNMLRKRIADSGVLVVPGRLLTSGATEERTVPEEFRSKHRSAAERKRLAKLTEEAQKDAEAVAKG